MSITQQHLFATQLAQLSRAWRAELDKRLQGLNLSQARWLVLLHLARFEQAPTQSELALEVGVEGPTLARLLSALQAEGLVERKAALEDRRAKHIYLTELARQRIEQIDGIAAALRAQVFNGISAEQVELCQQLHQTMLVNLESVNVP
ncbi:MarR family transcriptional regulator [Thiopseudomonas alkaliphila]|uniref:MarR family transcriptional regulator n=1 Tax=Thiopseudomonas alkaliphila TaxID=1697053 RepID=A0A0K1XFY5_9GAMM|nr:MarR family transcriptional regulator [Thiopseudomonas alkaliphila]AKX43771.1 MarR family transcriptional regulator [Thiopseudomonas alkaliphila]AKX46026.1 MarR family transcriptional regulator [Thiopseudomonas alkaliphila]AKX49110.1 MarR family transcriptional regulator [Thiopseudomonas alkaliphila]AKX51804.1 MarR family transcriptional regulator [Thiopseudomonas alkaliphila]AKX52994.1 MarR family transcriptional regulator [Thiopseudomonas alkaliphila]